MSKTVTVRLDEKTYRMIRSAAEADRRTISNFIESATVSHILQDSFASDEEMAGILADRPLVKRLKASVAAAKKGKFKVVG